MQRFLAFEFDEQKTTEHSNPSDADAADGYFNGAVLDCHKQTNMLNLNSPLHCTAYVTGCLKIECLFLWTRQVGKWCIPFPMLAGFFLKASLISIVSKSILPGNDERTVSCRLN